MSKAVRGAVRGTVAAMAMTGMRRVTTGVGLLERPPPERIAKEGVPGLLRRVPPRMRDETIELAHWGYGAAAGATFAALPHGVRRSRWVGPAYGIAMFALFQLVLRRLFGLNEARRKPHEHAALLADHVLYGLVVAARPERP